MKSEKDKFNKENRAETLPEKEKQLVREAEELPINVLELVNLLLVWRNLKPSVKLTYVFKEWGAGDPEPMLREERKKIRIEKFTGLLSAMKLKSVKKECIRQEPKFDNGLEIRGKESQDFFIARNLDAAQNLADGLIKEIETELNETIKSEIQKLSPALYVKMVKKLEEK